MRARSVVGWLCVFSAIAAVALAAYGLGVAVVPFLNGGVIYDFNWHGWPTNLVKDVSALGAGPAVEGRLQSFALERHRYERDGWDAALTMLIDLPPVVSAAPASTVAAIVVVDENGMRVADYPRGVARELPQFVAGAHQDWERNLRARVEENDQPPTGRADYYPIHRGPDRTGTMAILWRSGNKFAYVPTAFRYWSFGSARDAAALAIGLLALSCILLPVWVGMDAAWRGMRPFAWGMLVVVTGLVGLLAYLVARLSPPKPCPNCHEPVLSKYRRCPRCGTSLLGKCPTCGTVGKPGWQYCPVCAGSAAPSDTAPPPPVPTASPAPPAVPPRAAPAQRAPEPRLLVAVTDAESKSPLEGVLLSAKGPVSLEGTTNRSGEFQLMRLESGAYTITALKPGYEPEETVLYLDEGSNETVRLEMRARPATVSGRVIGPGAAPVAAAKVYPDTDRLERAAVTDDSGCYTIPDLPAGPYVLRAEAAGFEPRSRLVEPAPGQHLTADFTLEAVPDLQEQANG